MELKKIIVTGSNGQLGNELKDLQDFYPQFRFIFFNRDVLSINDEKAIQKVLEIQKPDYLINCAAYTAVDNAESEKEKAEEINGTAVGKLALACSQYLTKFIHISTDYVFNGKQNVPLKETDHVDPVNTYGETKLSGERLAFQNNPDSLIIRTSWVYSSYGKNFVKTMIRLMKERDKINVVNDQWGSPTYAADLAGTILQIIVSEKWVPGIYNFSNDGVITWFDFAKEIKRLRNSTCTIEPITTDQFPTAAKRPNYSVLDKSKIQQVYQIQLKDWEKSLQTCIAKLESSTIL